MKESNQTNNEQNSSLASAPLKSLLLKYSIPTTITLMVNYLYNIVDQIFVGQGVVFPKFIGSLFVSDDLIYLDCTKHFFRIYMGAFFLYGIHMTTASFFQGIGKPKRALLIPLSRQALFLIPISLILSSHFGLYGALLAVPIADILVFIVSILLIKSEFNSWRKNSLL